MFADVKTRAMLSFAMAFLFLNDIYPDWFTMLHINNFMNIRWCLLVSQERLDRTVWRAGITWGSHLVVYKGTNFIKSHIDSGRVGGEVVVFKRWFGFESASLGPSISTSEVWWYSMGILIYLYIYIYISTLALQSKSPWKWVNIWNQFKTSLTPHFSRLDGLYLARYIAAPEKNANSHLPLF